MILLVRSYLDDFVVERFDCRICHGNHTVDKVWVKMTLLEGPVQQLREFIKIEIEFKT